MNTPNPFDYGPVDGPDHLVGRDTELAMIANTIRDAGRLLVIGPRRYGKTSLLQAAAVEAERDGAIVLQFDAEKYETIELLAEAVLTAGSRALGGAVERTIAAVTEAAAHLSPRFTMDAGGRVSVAIGASHARSTSALAGALDVIESLASKQDRRVAVVLDEFQAAEEVLHATIEAHRSVAYIFAGSSVRLLTAMTSQAGHPFRDAASRLSLGGVPRASFGQFLKSRFNDNGAVIRAAGVEAILDLAADVPYSVQRLAYEIWEQLRAAEKRTVTPAMARAGVERIVRREDVAYTQLWMQFSRNRKKALKAVIEQGGAHLHSGAVSRQYALSTASMQTALNDLESAHVIHRDGERGAVVYRLVDPFQATWLEWAQRITPTAREQT